MNAKQLTATGKPFSYPLIFLCVSMLISACQPQPAPAEPTPPAAASATPVVEQTPEVLASPTPQAAALSEQPYASPSGAFEVFLPKDWNCSESGQYRVDCQPPQGGASLTLRATATGYELDQLAFMAFADAEMVLDYSQKKAYLETAREETEGLLAISADWREGDVQWQSSDIFTRSGAGIFQLSFSAEADLWEDFAPLFDLVNERVSLQPQAFSGAPIYAVTRKYTAPDLLFTLQVPNGWQKYADIGSIENTHLEGFLSPDKHAAVQVAIYRQGSLIKIEAKAVKTLEIMRKLYGYDLRVSHDKALPDGRERLEWTAAKRQVSGVSYFDSFGGSMYIFSVVWDDAFKDMYASTLDAVVTSFGHE